MKNGLENIDEVFKQAFDGFEANVDPSVWTNIQSSIATGTTPPADPVSTTVGSAATKAVALKIAAAVIAVGSIATATYLVITSPSEKKEVVAEVPMNNNLTVEAPLEKIEAVETNIVSEEKLVSEESITVNDNKVKGEIKKEVAVEKPEFPEDKGLKNLSDFGTESKSNDNKANTEEDTSTEDTKKQEATKPIVKPADKPKEKAETNDVPEIKPKTNVKITNPIPNIFTPNGDGQNDVFKITGENIDKMEVLVMDKTGKDLYWLRSVEDEWQGKDMGGYDLPSGVYFVAGSVKDKEGNTQVIKQMVQLNR